MICSLIAIVILMTLPAKVGAQESDERIRGVLTSDIRALVEGGGKVFAGMCPDLDQTANAGKWCATVLSQTTNNAEVRFGPMSSSTALPPVYYAKFVRHESGWLITSNTSPFNNGGVEVPPALRSAVRTYIEREGLKYAGLCSEIDKVRHAERWCVVLKDFKSTTAEIAYGKVSGAKTRTAVFIRNGTEWTLKQAPEVPAALRSAIKGLVESAGYVYAGLCDELEGQNGGKWCATIRSLDNTSAGIRAGEVNSGGTYRASFYKRNGAWLVDSHNIPLNLSQELRSAVQSAVQSAGYQFAGFCFEIDAAAQAGKWCANVQAVSTTQAQFTAGPVQSSSAYWAVFNLVSGSWTLTSSSIPLNVPADLRAAIQSAVQARGHVYAGLCREIDQTRHVGQHCAFVLSLTADQAYVTHGRVLSNEITPLQFVKRSGAWQLVVAPTPTPLSPTATPVPPTPAPPRPTATAVPPTATPTEVPAIPTPEPTAEPRENVPADLRAAIKALVEDAGYVYAGLCKEIDQVQHLGQRCAFVLSISESRAQVSYGLVLSDEVHLVELELVDGQWQPVEEEPEQAEGADYTAYLAFVLLGLGAVVASGFAFKVTRSHG